MAGHGAVVEWRAQPGEDFLAGRYSRAHRIGFDGGVELAGSASPSVVRAPWSVEAAADPEEMLVASVGACHMLTFLDLAKHAGHAVAAYRDQPLGAMGKTATGRIGLVRIALRPQIAWAGPAPDPAALDALHQRAHELCFIANSVSAEITIEPAAPGTAGAPGDAPHA